MRVLSGGRLFSIALQLRADSVHVTFFVSSLAVLIRFAIFQHQRLVAERAGTPGVTTTKSTAELRHLHHPNLIGKFDHIPPRKWPQVPMRASCGFPRCFGVKSI